MEHKWIFHETQKDMLFEGSSDRGNRKVTFNRVDVFYCENTCEIKEIEKTETVELVWGEKSEDVKPIWY